MTSQLEDYQKLASDLRTELDTLKTAQADKERELQTQLREMERERRQIKAELDRYEQMHV